MGHRSQYPARAAGPRAPHRASLRQISAIGRASSAPRRAHQCPHRARARWPPRRKTPFILLARCHIKPDADVDAYLAAARVADKAVMESEPGMLHHTFDVDPDDPRMFVWSEVYKDDEALLFHLTNPPLQKFVQQHSEEFGDGFSIEIYGTLDAETKKKFDATGFPIKYFDTKLGYSRVNDAKCAVM
ncbi:antibiotic biosynthesis monooxygenase [Aureococcus anophagefferens]|nr:antibiotic biosynthesis monooxygenase [Aureococcus anophagefferens]